MQLIAGNILDGLLDQFEEGSHNREYAQSLTKWLSYFELKGPDLPQQPRSAQQPYVNVLINALQRSRPTWLNAKALEFLCNQSPVCHVNREEFGLKVTWDPCVKERNSVLLACLHPVDPRITALDITANWQANGYALGSAQEEQFFFNAFQRTYGLAGDAFLQLLAPQRTLDSILKDQQPPNLPPHVRTDFKQQRSDFSIEFPYSQNFLYKGVVVEVDGGQHSDVRQMYLDGQRDEALAQIGWHNTIRIPTTNIYNSAYRHTIDTVFRNAVNSPYIATVIKNYSQPLLRDPFKKSLLEHALVPFAIARIQRTILQLIGQGFLRMDAAQWNIAVVERDIPCACLALLDLQESMQQLNILSPDVPPLPEIQLSVFVSPEFRDSPFQFAGRVSALTEFNSRSNFDCILDISVLQRQGIIFPVKSASPVYSIRSVHYLDTERIIFTSAHIPYAPIADKTLDERWEVRPGKEEALTYFLQSFFRKSSFRPGQIPIINKALQGRSVIGLLPTGGGKSITYQLSALLQPGVCLVIDPIRSLMKDQVDGLLDNQIDAAVFINSTLKGKEKAEAITKMVSGQAHFIFISPERLQMDEFRDLLKKMHHDRIFFSYCVIDEAHCVSEWGHDFRTAYLRLGINAYANCKTASNNSPVPLFGLTATASYDVLSDIQRELSAYGTYKLDEDSLVRFESTIRPEIQFLVEDISLTEKSYKNEWELKTALGEAKRRRIHTIMNELPKTMATFLDAPEDLFPQKDWEEKPEETGKKLEQLLLPDFDTQSFYSSRNGGLIFCPHKAGPYGITDQYKPEDNGRPQSLQGVFDHVRSRNGIKAGFFMGAGEEQDETAQKIIESSLENQTLFKKNRLNLMIATKAFGMGIDKPNIRYTIHMNYPGSIESFVQEAGRAGRDRSLAISYLLLNNQKFKIEKTGEEIDHDLDVNFYFHNNSFKGVSKEMAVLDELLTEIYFPDRTAEIESLIAKELEVEASCSYWEGKVKKLLFINKGYRQPYCTIDLDLLSGNTKDTIDPGLGNKIISIVTNYIRGMRLNMPASEWIQKSNKEIGIEKRLERLKTGEKFDIQIGFINNQVQRVQTLTQWLQVAVHPGFDTETVKTLRQNCNNADIFIEKICEKYKQLTNGQTLNFEAACKARDKVKNNPPGYAYSFFCNLFNAYRNKGDTEKAIYRLTTLGVIDDYTVDYNSRTFTLVGTKRPDKEYQQLLEHYLQKFYSEKVARQRLKEVEKTEEPTYIRKGLHFIVEFVYDTIKEKRANGIKEMKGACLEAVERGKEGNLFLREYIDLYFNSKYARRGYFFINEDGTVQASLTDATKEGIAANIKTVWNFIQYIDQDKTGTPLENTKHLRGACIRMITNNPFNYTLRLLNAFTLFMLEYRNRRLMEEAINHVSIGFELIEKEENPSDKELEKTFEKYYKLITTKNEALVESLKKANIQFDFEIIMISRTLNKLRTINKSLKSLNKTLELHGNERTKPIN
ncbi:DEAD/DEAH box helicase [Paraflavisolibacter sp. H34]|uniref:DEAD/DEAH box helicase n=1 Tax=Huijunlia imazamoxiresistens TaxID=3127457 RepID=UPI003015ECBD